MNAKILLLVGQILDYHPNDRADFEEMLLKYRNKLNLRLSTKFTVKEMQLFEGATKFKDTILKIKGLRLYRERKMFTLGEAVADVKALFEEHGWDWDCK